MSKYTIVDENDNPIGLKEKSEIQSKDIYRVAALWIYNTQGQILLAKRAMGKRNNPGKWMPVAVSGTVEDGETYEQNIVKEANEELGIDLAKYQYKRIFHRLMQGNHTFHLETFAAQIDLPTEAFVIEKEETSEIHWYDKEELRTLVQDKPEIFTPDAGRIIPELLDLV